MDLTRAVAASLLAAFLLAPSVASATPTWVPLQDAWCVSSVESHRCPSADGRYELDPGARLFLVVRGGETVRLSGANAHVGEGFGSSPSRASIVWSPQRARREIFVPLDAPVKWLVIEGRGNLRASVAREWSAPIAWSRFEEAYRDWARDRGPIPTPHVASAERLLRAAGETQRALRDASTPWRAAWLERLLEDWLVREQPLRSPWFERGDALDTAVTRHDPLVLDVDDEVVTLTLRGEPGTVVELFQGESLVRRLRWPPQGQTRARRARLGWLDGAQRNVRVAVSRGRATVHVERFERVARLDDAVRPRHVDLPLATRSADRSVATMLARGPSHETSSALLAAMSELARARTPAEIAAASASLLEAGDAPSLAALALMRLTEVDGRLPEAACRQAPGAPLSSPDDRALARALSAATCPVGTPGHARAGHALAALVVAHPTERRLAEVSALVVARERARRPLVPTEAVEIVRHVTTPRSADGLCEIRPDRYVRLPAGQRRLSVYGAQSIEARTGGERAEETELVVDDARVPVHGASGVPSRFALPQGDHTFGVPEGGPELWVRGPFAGVLRCDDLRSVHSTFSLAHETELALADDVTSILLETWSDRGASLTATIDTVTHEIELGAGHQLVSLPAHHARSLRLGSAASVVATVQAVSATDVQPPRTPRPTPALTEPQALTTLREGSRLLRLATTPFEQARANALRSGALLALGYTQLARELRDVSEESATAAPPTALERRNFASRIGPLAVNDERVLAEARALHAEHESVQARELLARAEVRGAGALLEATLAESAGDRPGAIDAWERVDDPSATLRAAILRLREARETRDVERALSAYAQAVAAVRAGARNERGSALTAMSRDFAWVEPAAMDGVAASRVIAFQPEHLARATRGERVRRAWVEAPDDATLLREGELLSLGLTLEQIQTFRLEGACAPFFGASSCTMEVRVDGAPFTDPSVTLDTGIELGAGRHLVEVVPSPDAIGWVRITGLRAPLDVRSRFFEARPQAPVELDVAGPTVVRVETLDSPLETLEVRVEGEVVPLQPLAVALDDRRAASLIAIEVARAHIEVRSTQGAPRVRLLSASPSFTAPATTTETSAEASLRLVRPPLEEARRTIPPLGQARDVGSISLVGNLRAVNAELADLDVLAHGSPYLEAEIGFTKRLDPYAAWVSASAFARARDGADTIGARAELDVLTPNPLPRVSLQLDVAAQNASRFAAAFGMRGSLWYSLRAGPWRVVPSLGFRLRTTGDVSPSGADIDPLVATSYYADRPFGLVARTVVYVRPLVELSLRAALSTTTTPELHSLDRIDASVLADALPFSGLFPWLSVGYAISVRPATWTRNVGFVRHSLIASATFFTWAYDDHRLTLGASAQWAFLQGRADLMIELGWLFGPGRGTRDLAPEDVEYRERLDEGASLAPSLGRSTQGAARGP